MFPSTTGTPGPSTIHFATVPPSAASLADNAARVAAFGSEGISPEQIQRGTKGRRRRREYVAQQMAVEKEALDRDAEIGNAKVRFIGEFMRALDMLVYYYFSYMYFLE